MIARWFMLLLVGAIGCQPSADSVVSKFRSELEAIKEKLDQIKNTLPESAEDIKAQLVPKLVLDEQSPEHNCESIMFLELAGAEPKHDLLLTSNLSSSLFWLDKPPSGGSSEFMERTMKAACKSRYLVVHRVDESQLPVAVSDTEFQGGLVQIDGFVIDMDSLEIVASYRVQAKPEESVQFSVKAGEDRKSRLQSFAHSSVWNNARQLVSEAIQSNTGGEVRLK